MEAVVVPFLVPYMSSAFKWKVFLVFQGHSLYWLDVSRYPEYSYQLDSGVMAFTREVCWLNNNLTLNSQTEIRRIRGTIIRTILCGVVYDSCTQWHAHMYEQFVKMSVGLAFVSSFGFSILCVCFFSILALAILFLCCCLLLLWSPYVIGQTIIFLPCDF